MEPKEQDTEFGPLAVPALVCPRCGARPALRISEAAIRMAGGQPPGRRIGTYKCQRRGCGAIYDVTAAAFQQAIRR